MNKKLIYPLLIIAGYLIFSQQQPADLSTEDVTTTIQSQMQSPGQWVSGQQVEGQGTVSRILSDDNDGSRHQRFILRLNSGWTLLIAHNIDLAPRISQLREGDLVSFYGEYEPNDRGGVIHWTHHDPRGTHEGGWLQHEGRRYQ